MDKGPWTLFYSKSPTDLVGVISDDFEHDVVLHVNGDFATPEDFKKYCEWLRDKLNTSPDAVQTESQ